MIFKQKFWHLLVLVLCFPAFSSLLKTGYYNMHDDMQVIRQYEFEKCLSDGQIPCRWTPDLGYGYGYPLFNYYPPLPYIVGQLFRAFHFSILDSIKLTAALQIILSAQFMFLLARSLFGPLGGLISALFFTYAPYHAVNIYIRGAMNEAWAATFFPLIFYYSRLLILRPSKASFVGLSLSFLCLLLSHNPMTLVFFPFVLFWCLFWYLTLPKPRYLLRHFTRFLFSGILSLSLAAFFVIPLLFETKFVQIESMFTGYYHFSVHFATLKQIFLSSFWGDGPSVWGTDDQMSFSIGYLHWILPTLIIIFSTYLLFKFRKVSHTLLLLFLIFAFGLLSLFLVHGRSTPLWLLITPIQKIQFPWRFLNLAVFFFSLVSGASVIFFHFNRRLNILFTTALIFLLLLLNVGYFRPIHSGPITDSQKLSGKSWQLLITSGIYDYLPKTANGAALGPAGEFVDQITPQSATYTVSGLKKGTNWQLANLRLEESAQLILSTLAFPHWTIYDNGQPIASQIEPQLGRLVVSLKPGNHQLFLTLQNTPVRSFANIASLFGLLFLVASPFLSPSLWKKISLNN